MQKKSIWKLSVMTTSILMVGGLLISPFPARADDDNGKCSVKTLHGDYGYSAEGVLLNVPTLPPEAQFRSTGVAHFDGKGNLTWVEHTVINGVSKETDWTPASGTYTVNANCTGAAVVITPNSFPPLYLHFAIVKDGKEVRSVLDSNSIGSVFIRVD